MLSTQMFSELCGAIRLQFSFGAGNRIRYYLLMSTFLRCENGHRWNPLSRRYAHSASARNQCPYCSVSITLTAPPPPAASFTTPVADPIFTATDPWNPERIHALAIYCSDGRFGEAFDEFCHRKLGIPRYDRFAVPGGPAWLNPSSSSSENLYHPARAQLDFLVRVHDLERIVLITHSPCAFYRELLHKELHDCLDAQFSDIHTASQRLRLWFPQIEVEGYLARLDERAISFHPIRT
jgi:hypothetical protein